MSLVVVPQLALRTLMLVLTLALLAGGLSAFRSASARSEALLVSLAEHGSDHDHSHDAGETSAGHTHHAGDHSHVVFGLLTLAGELDGPRTYKIRFSRNRVLVPRIGFDLERPPRPLFVA